MTSTAEILTFLEAACSTMGSTSAHRASWILDATGADLDRLVTGSVDGISDEDVFWAHNAMNRLEPTKVALWQSQIERLAERGIAVVTAGTESYPINLRLVPNRPPVLFIKGEIGPTDERAIAVVGTRSASPVGLQKAAEVASRLAKRGITVVSGLAEGIDTAAHRAALDNGGRTIAVFGSGISQVYPRSNARLAELVATSGACVSQWWPTQPVAKWTLPLRNIVTSGLSLGTVIIEASETSGAKLQANDARRHGRRLFLLEHLVTAQPWAHALVNEPGVHVVRHIHEILDAIEVDLDTNSPFSMI